MGRDPPFKYGLLGAFRFVCGNGLVVGKTFLHFKRRHVYELEDMGLDGEVKTALHRFNKQAGQWRRWEGTRLSGKAFKEIIKGMAFGEKAMALIDGHIEIESPWERSRQGAGHDPVAVLQCGHMVHHPPCSIVEL